MVAGGGRRSRGGEPDVGHPQPSFGFVIGPRPQDVLELVTNAPHRIDVDGVCELSRVAQDRDPVVVHLDEATEHRDNVQMSLSHAGDVLAAEFARRNAESIGFLSKFIADSGPSWREWSAKIPSLNTLQTDVAKNLAAFSAAGRAVFPALLALESLAALALAWATYHRLSRAASARRSHRFAIFASTINSSGA